MNESQKILYKAILPVIIETLKKTEMTPKDMSKKMGVKIDELKTWLKQAVKDGCIKKKIKPIRYCLVQWRQSKRSTIDLKEVETLGEIGLTDKQIAVFYGVNESTINEWKKNPDGSDSDFFQSIKKGKLVADNNVKEALYHRATGYSHPEDKIFYNSTLNIAHIEPTTKHYPPDTAAAFIWLKNRCGWSDKVNIDSKNENKNINITKDMSEEESAQKFIEFMKNFNSKVRRS